MSPGRHRPRLAIAALAAVLVALAALSATASAGSYIVAQCSPGVNSAAPDAAFVATSTHFKPFADCSQSAPGLGVNHGLSTGETGTQQGVYGMWVWTAPAGTCISGGSTFSRLATEVGLHGYLAVSPDSGGGVSYENQNDDQGHTAGIPPGCWRFVLARLECTQPTENGRCVGNGTGAHAFIKQVRIQLSDLVAPTVSISGSLLSGAVLRGPQSIEVAAADQGAGLRSVGVLVNGKPAAGDDLSAACNPLPGNLTSRLAPCPPSLTKAYTIDTAKAPFREGSNSIAVCASDYAQNGSPNTTCETREVIVDNLCPGSSIGGGKTVTAGFGNGKAHRTLAFRKSALIRGRLLDGANNPVVGAQVCVEGHTSLEGRPFHLIGTTTTNENGGWTYKLRHGPSRDIRIAYRDGAFQTSADLELDMRARSTFHVSVHRTCFGKRIYFSGGIAGPAPADRVVVVRGTIPGSKRTFLIRRAKTDPLGHFRVGYAFAPVARLTRFVFWSVVPEQAGYAYARGRSVVRYIRVRPHTCPHKSKKHKGKAHQKHGARSRRLIGHDARQRLRSPVVRGSHPAISSARPARR